MASSYEIGTTLETLTALDALTTPVVEPNFEFQQFGDEVTLGNGSTRGIGFPIARWIFAVIDDGGAQRTQLKSFCAEKSAPVYITTNDNSGTFKTYSAIMHWPLKEQKDNNWDNNLVLEFTQLVEIVEP
jgi:hypothetical protein